MPSGQYADVSLLTQNFPPLALIASPVKKTSESGATLQTPAVQGPEGTDIARGAIAAPRTASWQVSRVAKVLMAVVDNQVDRGLGLVG